MRTFLEETNATIQTILPSFYIFSIFIVLYIILYILYYLYYTILIHSFFDNRYHQTLPEWSFFCWWLAVETVLDAHGFPIS